MSAANVQFLTIEGEPCPEGLRPARFTFRCVHGNRDRHPDLSEIHCANLLIAGATDIPRDGQNQNGGRAQWDFDGNAAAPTFCPLDQLRERVRLAWLHPRRALRQH